jgi:hypothetical protein
MARDTIRWQWLDIKFGTVGRWMAAVVCGLWQLSQRGGGADAISENRPRLLRGNETLRNVTMRQGAHHGHDLALGWVF